MANRYGQSSLSEIAPSEPRVKETIAKEFITGDVIDVTTRMNLMCCHGRMTRGMSSLFPDMEKRLQTNSFGVLLDF